MMIKIPVFGGGGIIGGAELHVVKLDQLVKVPSLDVLEVKTDVARLVPHLLASKTIANVLPYCAANTRPCVRATTLLMPW